MEFVLVVPRDELFAGCYPHGMVLTEEIDGEALMERARQGAYFIERRKAETDPSLKQLIPYCLVLKPANRELFLMERLPKGGEARLHGKLSVGVGGHINPPDQAEGTDFIEAGLRREIEEEVNLTGEERLELLGFLNDDANPVGAVHFGLVYGLVLAPQGHAEVREIDAIAGGFKALEEIQGMCKNGANFESWSQAVLRRAPEWSPRLL